MRTLTNVRYILKLRRCLISLEVLGTLRCDVSVEHGIINIARGASRVMKDKKVISMYKLIGKTTVGGDIKVELCYD